MTDSPRSLQANEPILVVDDDPMIVRLVRTYLEREGFTVITANDASRRWLPLRSISRRLSCST